MSIRSIHRVALSTLLALAPLLVAGADYSRLLAEADGIRSAEPKRFMQLLDQLESRRGEADESQRQQLLYLDAYRKIVYGNEVDAGIAQAKLLFEKSKDPDLSFRAGSLVVNSLAINRRFTEGLRYLSQTLAVRGAVKDKAILHNGISVAAVVYNQLGQYKLGLDYAEEILAAAPEPRERCLAGLMRVEALYHLKSLPDGDASIAAVVDHCVSLNEHIAASFARTLLARQFVENGESDRAVSLLESNMGQVDAIGYPRLIVEYRALLAELSLQRGDVAAAQRHAEAAVAQKTDVSSSQPLAIAYRTLYRIAESRGEVAAALANYREYAEADKAWLNEAKARELAFQIVRHETLQQSQQIDLLNQENALLQLQQRVQQQSAQNSRLVMLVLALLLGFVGLWAYRTRRIQQSLRRMAETDALTEVSNRYHFTQQSEAMLAHCARTGEVVALMMFDLDHFKSINDRFGHGVGDWVLRKVVETCRPVCRQVDYFGRIGGEEFAILMAGYDLRAAKRMADDCRVRLAGIDTVASGHSFVVTASFGVTTTHLSGYDLTRLMSHADRALYRAKRGGRNKVSTFRIDVPVSPAVVHAVDAKPANGSAIAGPEPQSAVAKLRGVESA